MCKNRSSIKCIIPPYVNDKLVNSDNTNEQKVGVNTKFRSFKIRSSRNFIANTSDTVRSVLMSELTKAPAAKGPKIEVYNCKKSTKIEDAVKIWTNKDAKLPTDKDAKNVITAGNATWQFYYDLFARNSINNKGFTMRHYIHYDKKFDNAFWDGKQMLYGDGDGQYFGSFTTDMDIIGHELTHGVTQYECNLEYHDQPGALNESLSDVFGIMIKQRYLNQDAKTSDWLIGENVMLGDEYAIRSMKAPGTAFKNHPYFGDDPQPATMDKYVKLENTEEGDWGGVHYNSGIPNFAFYVTAYNLGGFAWEKAGRIWYAALTDKLNLKSNASFKDMRKATLNAATNLFGKTSLEVKAVKAGWDAAQVK